MKRWEADFLVQTGNGLSECPVWEEETQKLYWVDITGKMIFCLDRTTMEIEKWDMGSLVGMMALNSRGEIVAALEECVVLQKGEQRSLLCENPENDSVPGTCFNDGKCDRKGRLWVGTCNNLMAEKTAGLYRIDTDGQICKMLDGVTESNGIDWSPDDKYMYYVDTPSGILWRFDYDLETGEISNRTPLIDYTAEDGVFDGLTVDAAGIIWVAHWGGFKVSGWDPRTREKVAEILLPVPNVSCCAFGGEDNKTLFITTSVGRDKSVATRYPLSGSIFQTQMETPGQRCNRYNLGGKQR